MFKPGDKVLCVRGKLFIGIAHNLEEGKTYTVAQVIIKQDGDVFVELEEFEDIPLYISRFVLADNYNPVLTKVRQMNLRQEKGRERGNKHESPSW